MRQSKYIHSRGIRHDDIKPGNLLIKNHQCFLIDYNLSSEMRKDTNLCTYAYKPRRCYRNFTRFPIDDFESFFFTMCHLNGVKLKWFFTNEYNHLNKREIDRRIGEAKMDIDEILVRSTYSSMYSLLLFMKFRRISNLLASRKSTLFFHLF